jgi:hypothetical protein
MSAASPNPVPSPESLASFSAERDEPAWLSEFRQENLRKFTENPPVDGRYTRLKLDWKRLSTKTPSFPAVPLPAEGLVLATTATSSPALALAPWAASGAGSLADLARPRQPFDHLVFASWSYGLVFRWEEGDGGGPTRYLAPEPKPDMVLEPLLLDVGERAHGELFVHWKGADAPGLRLTTLTGKVGPHASLKLVLLGEGGQGHHHISLNLDLAEGAEVEVFGAWLGGRWTVLRGEARMASPGASWKETHLVWGAHKDHTDIETRILHLAPHTRSDIHARAALAGSARSVFTGNVVMEKEAVQADAHLEDHVLLLSDTARSDSIPALEIRAMDVKASHAASIGQVDSEALFYLLSRGLDEDQARHLLVKGFLASLVERAPFPFLSDLVETALEARVSA